MNSNLDGLSWFGKTTLQRDISLVEDFGVSRASISWQARFSLQILILTVLMSWQYAWWTGPLEFSWFHENILEQGPVRCCNLSIRHRKLKSSKKKLAEGEKNKFMMCWTNNPVKFARVVGWLVIFPGNKRKIKSGKNSLICQKMFFFFLFSFFV